MFSCICENFYERKTVIKGKNIDETKETVSNKKCASYKFQRLYILNRY